MMNKEALLTNGNQKTIYIIHSGLSGSGNWDAGYRPGVCGSYSKATPSLPDLGSLYTHHRKSPGGMGESRTYSEASPKGYYTRLDSPEERFDFSSGRYEGYFFSKEDNGKDIPVLYEPL